ncbi:phosphoglycan beta 1,3 galactosyltransferase 4 [Novymonas esmeraldas]|uniref:Phosphoglycan beta 1,3 galactosyltransferase 4 n=1 Tax=Novymonas esmeraldas TaxID=1808958 RepID=A0AAW0EZ82_9TRYP
MHRTHDGDVEVELSDLQKPVSRGARSTGATSVFSLLRPLLPSAVYSRVRAEAAPDVTQSPTPDESTSGDEAKAKDTLDVARLVRSLVRGVLQRLSNLRSIQSQPPRKQATILTILLAVLVVLCYSLVRLIVYHPPPQPRPVLLPWEVAEITSPPRTFSVVVQHESASHRLTKAQRVRVIVKPGDLVRLEYSQLPSWTLRVITASCTACLDNGTYITAVAGVPEDVMGGDNKKQKRYAPLPVFATTSAPLGLMGPLLFAMASVTDDVDVAAELRRWPWVTRSYAQLRDGAGGGAPRHLIVMGIPSTDQPMRYPLRDVQRATWMTYREVARAENDFTGALLPLYVLAAAERDKRRDSGTLDMDQLTPTVGEYVVASAQRRGTTIVPADYEQRRVVLREGWRDVPRSDAAVWESPCAAVKASVVRAGSVTATSSPLVQLSSALALPVMPAFTAAARYICHASTALWQEALRHRNSVWIDMLTDRKPTSGKTMGMGISWGMPTEVGMSQKVVTWLNYAYTAFPDVPYIMKGDDDTYLKVPQYLSDLRYARGGVDRARNLTAEIPHGGVVPVTEAVHDDEECFYRIACHYTSDTVYGNGVGYTLDRRLIQASMNPFDQSNAVLLRLLTMPYNSSLDKAYLSLTMQFEDVLVGKQVRDHAEAVQNTCPRRRVCYLWDKRSRAHQVLRPPRTSVTWASMLEHYGMPAIPYYLHYFHKKEFRVAAEAKVALAHGANISDVEANATAHMQDWVRSQVPSTLVGLGSELDVDWVRGAERVAYIVAEEDEVAVYDVRYQFRQRRGAECNYETII